MILLELIYRSAVSHVKAADLIKYKNDIYRGTFLQLLMFLFILLQRLFLVIGDGICKMVNKKKNTDPS